MIPIPTYLLWTLSITVLDFAPEGQQDSIVGTLWAKTFNNLKMEYLKFGILVLLLDQLDHFWMFDGFFKVSSYIFYVEAVQ